MHLSVVLVILAIAGTVYSDSCSNAANCVQHGTTQCTHHTHVFCDTRINQCICTANSVQSGASCSGVGDCANCSGGQHKHCVDGHCVCFRI